MSGRQSQWPNVRVRDQVRRRPKRTWPICPATGKQRLGERKDAKVTLEAARHHRAHAALIGQTSGWTVRREYRCEHCRGWHLTSQPAADRTDEGMCSDGCG